MTKALRYKRSQLERALWASLPGAQTNQKPSPRFLGRIKKLLDVDRTIVSSRPAADRAFTDQGDIGRGSDAEFTHFNAFCLALGLDLLELGFKQSEIVTFFRHTRALFEEAFGSIAKSSPVIDLPTFPPKSGGVPLRRIGGHYYVDYRQYALIQRIELTEPFGKYHKEKRSKGAMMLMPRFYRGIEQVTQAIDSQPIDLRRFVVIELTALFLRLKWALDETEAVPRGRRAS